MVFGFSIPLRSKILRTALIGIASIRVFKSLRFLRVDAADLTSIEMRRSVNLRRRGLSKEGASPDALFFTSATFVTFWGATISLGFFKVDDAAGAVLMRFFE